VRPFIAVDGEAVNDRYVLMCAASHRNRLQHMWAADEKAGLDTASCFEFLLMLAKRGELVCFGLNYDANNWCRDLPLPQLQALQKNNIAYWFDYRIEWLPGRWFAIKHIDGRYARIQEVFGFFQSSFVNALAKWGIQAGAEVEEMKKLRGTFSAAIKNRVLDYCYTECEQLSQLMTMLRDACKDADITPRSWIGAGAIASALLNRQGVAPHHEYDLEIARVPEGEIEHPAVTAVLSAYFGGRVELLAQGIYSRVYTIDIRSAYPSAAQNLPSLTNAQLTPRKRYNPNARHAIWYVEWDCTNDPRRVMPFPARRKRSIYYPRKGCGWYHAPEVAAALALRYNVRVIKGYVLQQKIGELPFHWIPEVYAERARLKREGKAAEKVVKLALNSVYGKLAQGKGFGSRPRWQSYMWAGEITSATRAKMLTATAKITHPIMISTDGIFAKAHRMRDQNRLGGWELGEIRDMFAGQPGVYSGMSPDGKEVVKSRGFFAREVDYAELADGYRAEGIHYIHHYESTRFVGLGTSLHRGRMDLWCRWVTERRTLALQPQRKQISENEISPWPHYVESEPYTPKGDLFETPEGATYAEGMEQPLRDY
jgi:hypothetical protein